MLAAFRTWLSEDKVDDDSDVEDEDVDATPQDLCIRVREGARDDITFTEACQLLCAHSATRRSEVDEVTTFKYCVSH